MKLRDVEVGRSYYVRLRNAEQPAVAVATGGGKVTVKLMAWCPGCGWNPHRTVPASKLRDPRRGYGAE